MPRQSQSLPHRFTGDYQLGLYGENRMGTTYFQDSGQLALAVQGVAGTACEIVNVDAPSGGKLVQFQVTRFGLMPLFPGVEKSDPNVIYLCGQVYVDAPAVTMDENRYWYGVSGWYAYAFLKPLTFGVDPLPMGATTIDRTDPTLNVLPAAAAVDMQKPLKGQNAAGDQTAIVNQLVPRAARP